MYKYIELVTTNLFGYILFIMSLYSLTFPAHTHNVQILNYTVSWSCVLLIATIFILFLNDTNAVFIKLKIWILTITLIIAYYPYFITNECSCDFYNLYEC